MILFRNNYEDERIFSTGDSELDDILEEVYYSGISDGYNYAQEERLFAKKKSEEEKKESKKATLEGIGAGMLVGTAANTLGSLGAQELVNNMKNGKRISEAENKALTEKLLDKAKKSGIEVIDAPGGANSAYYGLESAQKHRNRAKKIYNKLKSKNPKAAEKFKDSVEAVAERSAKSSGMSGTGKHLGKDLVAVGEGRLADADILSHELGHSALGAGKIGKGRSKDIVGKGAHKLYNAGKFGMSAGTIVGGVTGYKSGLKAAKLEAEGKKEKTWDKVKSVAIPAAMVSPILVSEAAASRHGIKLLKEAGASKEALKTAKRSLGKAWGSYAAVGSAGAVTGAGSRAIGKAVGRKRYGKKKEEED